MAEESRTLQIVLQARDEASRTIQQVGDAASNLGSTIKDKLKENVVGLGAAFAATSAIVGTSIAAFAESENVALLLDSAIRSTGGAAGVTAEEMLKLSAALQQQSRFSDEAITSAETLLIRFGNIGKDVIPGATQAVLDLATGMGVDLQTAAMSVGIALSHPAEGIGRLARSIPAFKGALGDTIQKLEESGHHLEAQKLILDTLSTSFGGSAKTSAKSFGGQLDILKNTVNDLQETIGKELVKELVNLTGGFDKVTGQVKVLNEFLKSHHDILLGVVGGLLLLTAGFGVLLVAAMAAAAGASLAFVGSIALVLAAIGFLAGVLIVQWGAIMTLAGQLKDSIGVAFQGISDSVMGALASAQESITSFVNSGIGIFNAFVAFLNSIPAAVGAFVTSALEFLAQLPAQFGALVLLFLEQAGFLIGFLSTAIPQMVLDIVTWFSTLPAQLFAIWTVIQTDAVTTWNATWLSIVALVTQLVNDVITFLSQLPGAVLAIFQLVVNSIVERVTFVATWIKTELSAWPGRIQGFIATIPTIVGTIFEEAKTAVLNKMAEMFKGVSEWWDKIKGILEGIKNAAEAAISAVARGLAAGAKAGSRQFGGFVPTTGLALLHAGEFVLSRDMQAGRTPISPSVANNFSQPITINASIQSEPDWDALGFRLAWILRNSR